MCVYIELISSLSYCLMMVSCYLQNIWEFVYFVWSLSPPKRRVVRWRNFACRRV